MGRTHLPRSRVVLRTSKAKTLLESWVFITWNCSNKFYFLKASIHITLMKIKKTKKEKGFVSWKQSQLLGLSSTFNRMSWHFHMVGRKLFEGWFLAHFILRDAVWTSCWLQSSTGEAMSLVLTQERKAFAKPVPLPGFCSELLTSPASPGPLRSTCET